MFSQRGILTIFFVCAVFVTTANAECCTYGYQSFLDYGERCLDCQPLTEGNYCGVGPCNIFGCNCDGGCRRPAPDANPNSQGYCPVWRLVTTRNVYPYVLCKADGICDDPKPLRRLLAEDDNADVDDDMMATTSLPTEAPANATAASPCVLKLAEKYGNQVMPSLSTAEEVKDLFDCIDTNGDGKITVEEGCAELNCDEPNSRFTKVAVAAAFKEMGDASTEYITPEEFDVSLKDTTASAPTASAAVPVSFGVCMIVTVMAICMAFFL